MCMTQWFGNLNVGSWSAAMRFLVVSAIVVGLRLPTVNQTVIDWDESVYLVVAQDLVRGGELYRTVWDHKGPLLYTMLVPVVSIADGQLAPIRWYTTLILLLTMFFVDLIGRHISSPDWSFVGALVYGLFFSIPRFGGLAANGELFMMLPAVLSIWCVVRWLSTENGGRGAIAASGLFAALAVFTKTTVVFTIAVVPLLVFARAVSRKTPRWLAGGGDFAALFAPPLLISGLILGWFWFTARLPDYLFATFGFNRAYVSGTPFLESWERFAAFFAWAAIGDTLTALAVIGAVFLAMKTPPIADRRWIRTLVIGLGIFSFLGVISARNLFFHYYLQMALPIAIVITLLVSALGIQQTNWRRLSWITLILGLVSAFSPHRFNSEGLTQKPAEDRVLTEVAAFIDEHAGGGDELYVLGGEPVLYYLCDRKSPSKYFFWLYLTDRWDDILGSRKSVLGTFATKPPEWFVVAPHDLRPPGIETFLYGRYELVREIGNYQIARLAH